MTGFSSFAATAHPHVDHAGEEDLAAPAASQAATTPGWTPRTCTPKRLWGQPESAGPGSACDGAVPGRRARQAGYLTEEISVTGGPRDGGRPQR